VALIDDVLPRFDANELHSVALRLEPARAIALALAAPISDDPVIAALFRLRGINARGSIGSALTRLGLEELCSAEGDVVFGASGTPWRPGGGIHPSVSSVRREGRYSAPTQPAYPIASRWVNSAG